MERNIKGYRKWWKIWARISKKCVLPVQAKTSERSSISGTKSNQSSMLSIRSTVVSNWNVRLLKIELKRFSDD